MTMKQPESLEARQLEAQLQAALATTQRQLQETQKAKQQQLEAFLEARASIEEQLQATQAATQQQLEAYLKTRASMQEQLQASLQALAASKQKLLASAVAAGPTYGP